MTHNNSWVTIALIPGREQEGIESGYLWTENVQLEKSP